MSDGMRDAERPFSSQKGADLTPPLDLRAVEARNAPDVCEHGSDARALLAHVRALRVALEPFLEMGKIEGKYLSSRPDTNTAVICVNLGAFRRAAAVLAQATDA